MTVIKGWNGALEEQHFLREVHAGACRHFATVLGPGVAMHHDHLHMDLARHGRRGDRSVCRPYPQAVPPPNEGFPIDPAKNMPMADAGQRLQQGRDVYAFAAPRPNAATPLPPSAIGPAAGALPAYRPSQLPQAPRNPIAEREEEALRNAPPRTAIQAGAARGRAGDALRQGAWAFPAAAGA